MLTKFETKSNRVKGVSFHPKRPWILASLHNGIIQMWDYQLGTLIDKFEEHEGPVRTVSFHHTQPLFVSGGDDYKIKVWNWKQRRCLFSLNGHLDYIRTVFFHLESPWIISASDDQTIRIWNWQNRNCLAILTGHSHYVMCAQFHPKDDLVVSASLDQTVRVWDISGLRKKNSSPGSQNFETITDSRIAFHSQQAQDPFGNTDAMVKYVLEGHDRGVNWASFHPTMPLIVSGGDDRVVKLWRMNETKAWAVDTCRGHYNNVSSAIFHPKLDLIISVSEDKTIRIWDMNKRTTIQTMRREHDRFWSIAAHPELNLFAAGHDHGFIVYKLERERPAMTLHQNLLFYVKDKFIRAYDFTDGKDVPIITIDRGLPGQIAPPRSLSYNPAENAIIMTSDHEGGMYEVHTLPKMLNGIPKEKSFDLKRGSADSACYVARNKFATFSKSTQTIAIKDSTNSIIKSVNAPSNATSMLIAGPRNFLLATPTAVLLYDSETRANLYEIAINAARSAYWSNDGNYLAIMSKHSIVITNKNLEQLAFIHETIKLKSGIWDDNGVFLYTTLNHIKFTLVNGDNGIIKTIEYPMYLVKSVGNAIFVLDREANIRQIPFDPTEYLFKLALNNKNYDQVLHIIKTSNLVGQSIIGYLEKKGYPEVALQFVRDPKVRFELALECGNIEVALEMAKAIDKDEFWHSLGAEALLQGNYQIVEMVYQKIKEYEKLSFLYLVTGNIEKLKKMLKIAELRNDTMARYHNAMYLGDVEDQIVCLKEVGQLPLAYLAAQSHGLTEEADAILEAAGLSEHPPIATDAQLLKTPTPIFKEFDEPWPLLQVKKNIFESGPAATSPIEQKAEEKVMSAFEDEKPWDVDLDFHDALTNGKKSGDVMEENPLDVVEFDDEGDGWGLDEDLDISPTEEVNGSLQVASVEFSFPNSGISPRDSWVRNSSLAVDHAAAGSFETAMQLLNRQVGVVQFQPLKSLFLTAWLGSQVSFSCQSTLPSLLLPIHRNASEEMTRNQQLPFVPFKTANLINKIREANQLTSSGKSLDVALGMYRSVLQQILMTVAETSEQLAEIHQLVHTCREYCLGLSMDLVRRELNMEQEPARVLELAAYFTHCGLESNHLEIILNVAMKIAFKLKNYATAYTFATRLLDMGVAAQIAQIAKKIQLNCEKINRDEIQLDYDSYNPFVICAESFKPILKGSPVINCPFCGASFKPQFKGKICSICQVSKIGATGTGLRNALEQK